MTQRSQPQGGYFNPLTLPDSGPYSFDEWAALLGSLQRAGVVLSTTGPLQIDTSFNDTGVFYAIANRLEVTNPGGAASTLQIDTGASMTGGIFHLNDVAVTLTVPANRTNDLIVVRQNYTNATYIPPASVDADEEVPPDTARITRVTALVNDATLATYWDIPLADFTTDGAGAVTINSDDRVWVDAETKRMWVQVMAGYNGSAVANIPVTPDGSGIVYGGVVIMPSIIASSTYAYATTIVPNDFISSMISTAVGKGSIPGAAAISCNNIATYAACGELFQVSDSTGVSGVAVEDDAYYCIKPLTLASPAVGDVIELQFIRGNTDAYPGNWDMFGWFIDYLGWGRR